jgi:hypothetical protein
LKIFCQEGERYDLENFLVPRHAADQHVRDRHQAIANGFEQLRAFVAQGAPGFDHEFQLSIGFALYHLGELDQPDALMVFRGPNGVGLPGRFCACRPCDQADDHNRQDCCSEPFHHAEPPFCE